MMKIIIKHFILKSEGIKGYLLIVKKKIAEHGKTVNADMQEDRFNLCFNIGTKHFASARCFFHTKIQKEVDFMKRI